MELLLAFGHHLIAVYEDNVVKIWDIKSEQVYLEISLDPTQFKVSALIHPPTYANKILLGSDQGGLQLWNVKTSKLIHTFKPFDAKVTTLEAAPATDVVVVGLQNGKIVLLNLKYDEILMEFNQECGAVTSISFRTDGHSTMATGSSSGRINLWNLDKRKLWQILDAHFGPVTTIHFFVREPLMFTASPDNSIKLWIFDMPDGGPRLLRRREGHAAPPLCIRYHGAGGRHIVSAGSDSTMRIFNTVSETLNRSMGRATYDKAVTKKKGGKSDALVMPPVMNFTNETTRDKEWDSIAAIHRDYKVTTTWSFDRCTMGTLRLVPESLQEKGRKDFTSVASCICLTHCGNFVIIGYSNGQVHRFNIQSGIHRATYGNPAHTSAIQGVAVDNLNQIVISGGQNGEIKFWPFRVDVNRNEAVKVMELGEAINFFCSHRESSLLCVALEDFTVVLIDVDSRNVARKFSGHKGRLTDACFSPDGRWLVTTAMDCVVKVFDIPSSYMIDHFWVDSPVVSMTISPTGDFLATAHVDYLGINLWANKTLFNHISLRALKPESEPYSMSYPVSVVDQAELDDEDNFAEDELPEYKTPMKISEDLITLSELALSRWMNLLNLDVCKKRNKPKQPPKQPKQAPFFLPTVAGLEMRFDLSQVESEQTDQTKIVPTTHIDNITSFGRLLKATIATDDFDDAIQKLVSLNVSALDFEIKSLSPIGGGSIALMLQFLKLIIQMLSSNLYFELAQSYLGVFLKSHPEVIVENEELANMLEEVEVAQSQGWKRLEDRMFYGIGVVSALRNYAIN